MPVLVIYLLKLSISLAVTWLFYQSMLRRLTFYNLNRWYLLGYSLLSFIIPLINIGSFLREDTLQNPLVFYLPRIGGHATERVVQGPGFFARLDSWDILLLVLLTGSMVLLIRLLVRWASLRRVRRQARLVGDGGVKVFEVDQRIRPFSFGDAIYINPRLHTEKEYSTIILHEYVHIRQRHTVDILLSEWLCIVNWFNPFVWLIRYSIRQNLEFIADRKVLEKGLDKKGYQYHLLQVVGVPGYRLANNFNFSSLKKRIIMMNRIKSARTQLLKFLFLLPLLAVLLLAFREQIKSAPAGTSSAMRSLTGDTARRDTLNQAPLAVFHDTLRLVRVSSAPPTSDGESDTVPVLRATPGADTTPGKADLGNPLFIVDGVEMKKGWSLNAIFPRNIQAVSVLKDKAAIAQYGAKGANGVLLITTKQPLTVVGFRRDTSTAKIISDSAAANPPTVIGYRRDTATTIVRIRLADSAAARPLYYLDGVEISDKEMKALNPADIESINVLKDMDPHGKYGKRGINGVILIQSKKKEPAGRDPQPMIIDDKKG